MSSLKKNVIWAFVANGVTAGCTWLMLMVLTKVASATEVGLFALAQAVTLPIHMFFTFKLRIVQSTDHRSEFTDDHYRHFRILSSIANFIVAAVISRFLYTGQLYFLILIMALSYSFVVYREFYISVLQKYERNDLIAYSNIVQGSGSLVLFLAGFWATKLLWVGMAGILLARWVLTLVYDRYLCAELSNWGKESLSNAVQDPVQLKSQLALLGIGLPLGGVALLGTLFTSIPRLVLDKYISLDAVGYYAALASVLVVLNLFVTSFAQSITPRLALLYIERRREFLLKFSLFFLVCMGFTLLCVIFSYYFGAYLLTQLFTEKYAAYSSTFFKLMIAGALLAAFSIMNIAISAQRIFRVQFPIYLACVLVIFISSVVTIPKFGIDGAAYSYALCNLIGFVLCLTVFIKGMRKAESEPIQ